jgi:adenylate cyclase
MSSIYKQRPLNRVRFSIGAKLIVIILVILVVSLGSITALSVWLGFTDLKRTAEGNNLEINRRSAMEAETLLANIQSNSRVLIQNISILGSQTSAIKESMDFFFTENQQIGSVFFVIPGRQEQLLINKPFFTSRNIDEGTVPSFFDGNRAALGRAVRGEIVLQNAAPHFSKPVLGLFFPWQGGGVVAVLFSGDELNKSFGYKANNSYMVNTDGDILSYSDFDIVKEKTNIKNMDFFRAILESTERDKQEIMETDFGVVRTSFDNVNNPILGVFGPVWEKVKPKIRLVIDKSVETLKRYDILRDGVKNKVKVKEKRPRQFVAYTKLNSTKAIVITSVEYDKVFEGFKAAIMSNICLAIAVLIISIIFIWFFSRTISLPLRSLAFAANKIEYGNFDQQLHSKALDEIGALTFNFGKMCSALKVFGNFSNKEIAVKAISGEIKPGGLAKHGTILFTDISDFTTRYENFIRFFGAEASDKIVLWLNEYFTQMLDCVNKTGGTVDKFIGPAVMAHWGTASSSGSPRKDAFNSIKAALMMRKVLYYINKERKSGDVSNPLMRIGCGISSGVVTAGQLGSDTRMNYTVLGDPVNLALLVKAFTRPFGADILVCEDTWKLVGDKFITEEMPSVPVKGKAKPVRTFAIVNFAGDIKGPQSLEEVRTLLGIDPPELDKADVSAFESIINF